MANKMLIDATHPEETRVVVIRGNRVEEFDFESASRKQLRGNIYLAKVTRVEPSLQAAFVDYGGNRHGFLAFSEIHPDYYQIPVADRQALIDEESRAHRDAEADEEHGRGRRRHRHRNRGSDRRRDAMRSARVQDSQPAVSVAEAEPTFAGGHIDEASSFFPPEATVAPTPSPASPPPVESENDATHADAFATAEPEQIEASEAAQASFSDEQNADAPSGEGQPLPEGPEDESAGIEAHDIASENEHDADGEDEVEAVESIGGEQDVMEEVQERTPRYRRQYKIQEVIKRRQVMLVQVVKEERGTKGAALTTYLSLAGRYSVLMPNTARGGGISRKITSAEDRKRLKEVAEELDVPEGMGVILRTAGASRTKTEVKRDFEYLMRLWETVRDLTLRSTAPKLVYEEGSLVKRSIRDLYHKDIDEIIVEGEDAYREAKDFMRMLMPSHAKHVKLYKNGQPVFARFGIETQLDAMFQPTVQLKSGGYIVINQTEALVAIDVNSGRATREHNIEDTALKTNLEAAAEVARQLRLRDLAGLIVVDFIDMEENRNNRAVERKMKEALKSDRARIQVGRISHFGLLEMSRQRIRTSVLESSTDICAHCGGTGHVRSVASVALQLIRGLEEMLLKGATHNLIVRTRADVALYVLNHKRAHLRALEERFRIAIAVNADASVTGQPPFAIDRGEQVMTLEQAKALLSDTTADQPIEEEEAEEAFKDDLAQSFEEESADEESEAQAEGESSESEHETAERDGRRRRRGRRGRGRNRHRDREQNGQPHEHAATEAEENFAGAPEDAESEDNEREADAEQTTQPQHGESDGERRRRRRGRRGGRRNRRDRDYQNGDTPHDEAHADGAHADEAPSPAHESYESTAPAAAPQVAEAAAPAAPFQPETAHEEEREQMRRRSTVREPAPRLDDGTENPAPAPAPEPAPATPSEPVADEPQAERPRRFGWWSRKG